jgi:hypothetical protein
MNSYSGWVWVLSGQILAIGLKERVRTRRPDRSAVQAGLAEWVACGEEKVLAGWSSARILAHGQRKIENSFPLFKSFRNQTLSIQIQI